jgi:hypothetical protein
MSVSHRSFENYPSALWPQLAKIAAYNSILKFFSLAIRAVLIFQVLHSIGATHNHGVAFG